MRGERHASHDIFFCAPLQSAGYVLFWDNLKSEKGSTFAVLPYIQVTCEVTEHCRTSDEKYLQNYSPRFFFSTSASIIARTFRGRPNRVINPLASL